MSKFKLLICLILFCFYGLVLAQTFELPISVTDGLGHSQILIIAMDCAGTDGYEICIDQPAPPAPQPGVFDARLITASDAFYTDVRASTTNQTEYEVGYQPATGGTIVMTWDNTAVAALGSFQIVDNVTGTLINPPIDMSTTNTFTPTDDGFGGAVAADGVVIRVNATAQTTFPLFDLGVVSKNITTDGLSSFNASNCEETAININFTGVSSSGCINVKSFSSPPNSNDIPRTYVSQYRWEIENNGVNFTNAEVRFNISQIPNAGIGNPPTVEVWQSATPGSGSFTMLPTSLDGDTALVVNVSSFSEFVFASDDPDNPLPVELTVFEVQISNGNVVLNWITESELNNLGFEVWRSDEENGQYTLLSSYSNNPKLEGHGNSSAQHEYSFVDELVVNGQTYWYKISDVDFNGNRTFHGPKSITIPLVYDDVIAINTDIPQNFKLYQNFPNPFNPNTTIQFDIPTVSENLADVRLIIFNNLGQSVNAIFEGKLSGGSYQIQWDGTNDLGKNVPSGIYYAFLNVNYFSETMKMILLR